MTLRGTVRARGVLTGTVAPSMTLPRYAGPYDVTPASGAQVLATKGLAMSSDVTVGGMGEAIEKAEREALGRLVDGSFEGVYRNEELTTLRVAAFQGCTGLTGLELPALTTMGNSALQGCTGLTGLELPALTGRVTGTTMNNALQECTSLRRIDWPNFGWSGGTQMFYKCTSLEFIRLGKSTDLSGWNMFHGCTALSTADFPALRMLRAAFPDSALLDALILRNASSVCSLSAASNLTGTPIAAGTGHIYVPRALVDKYKAATNWSVYADQIRAIEDYPDICDPD